MIGLAQLALLYLLLGAAGARIASRLPLAGRLDRWLVIGACGSMQLLASIQILSLWHALKGGALLALNAAITGLLWWTASHWPAADSRKEPLPAWNSLKSFARAQPLEALCLTSAMVAILAGVTLGAFTYPFGDNYHAAMPLYWKQHASLLPFPIFDPRIIGVVFAGEGLSFPGFLYTKMGGALCSALSGLAAGMSLWILAAIARRLGASVPAAVCAASMIAGFGPVLVAYFQANADLLLSGMWFAGSVYFLFSPRDAGGGIRILELGLSMVCLALACATKNIVVLQIPAWSLAAFLRHGKALFRPKHLITLGICGFAGLLLSGFIWSYVNNARWFGSIKGGRELQHTLSTEMQPRAVWTRLVRSGVTFVMDVIWVPQRHRDAYAAACVRAVTALGGQERLNEDWGFYSFTPKGLEPGLGLGPLGTLLFIPATLVALLQGFRSRSAGGDLRDYWILALLTAGSYLTCYGILRWQSIGTTRLMVSCALAGAPLAALLFEKAWCRRASIGLWALALGMYFVSNLGSGLRHTNFLENSWLSSRLAWLQRDRSVQITYRWQDGTQETLRLREDFTRREVFQHLLERLPQPAVIGAIGSMNLESSYLFGGGHQNRVVPLLDSRTPDRFLPTPAEVQFIVVVDLPGFQPRQPEIFPGFEIWLEVTDGETPVLTAFKRRA